jgi:hypothetical protein
VANCRPFSARRVNNCQPHMPLHCLREESVFPASLWAERNRYRERILTVLGMHILPFE